MVYRIYCFYGHLCWAFPRRGIYFKDREYPYSNGLWVCVYIISLRGRGFGIGVVSMIKEKVLAIIADQDGIDPETIQLSAKLGSLGLDSLDAVEITMHIEEEFNVAIEPDYTSDTVVSDVIWQVGRLVG